MIPRHAIFWFDTWHQDTTLAHIAVEIESGSQRPSRYKREKEARVWENVRGNLAHPANFRLSVSLEEEEARSLSLWATELLPPC